MDGRYSYRQHRFRPNPQMSQQSNPLCRSSELDYSVSGTATVGVGRNYVSNSGSSYVEVEKQPRRSQSLNNRRDWLLRDDYGFPSVETEERFNIPTRRYQSHQQRNYNYKPYLSVGTGPAAGHRGDYDKRSDADHYFDNFVNQQCNPAESDWDALDRSIRNYREDPSCEQRAVATRRLKAQSLPPGRSSGLIGGVGRDGKSRRHNLPSVYLYQHSGTGSGFTAPQNGISINRIDSVHRARNDYASGLALNDEMEFVTDRNMLNYYQSNNCNHQLKYYGQGARTTNDNCPMRGRTMIRGRSGARYGFGAQKYYKFHCCCLSFRWPPWAFEEVEPPQQIYRRT